MVRAMSDLDTARGRMLAELLESTRYASPDEVPAHVVAAGRRLGADNVAIYLVDHGQVALRPLRAGRRPPEELDVDATLAGRCYRTLTSLVSDDGDTRGTRLWVPLVNGSNRLGVLAVDLPQEPDEAVRDGAAELAALTAELLVSKGAYGDAFELVRRRRDVTLPAEVQRNLLPPLTALVGDIGIAGALEPSYAIAGDAFDYAIDRDSVQWAMVDAMGHGLEAALLASVSLAAYRHFRRRGGGLAATLAEMDAAVAAQFGGDRFLTGLLGELDRRSGRMRLLQAGHHPPVLARDGRVVRELTSEPALPIGLNEHRAAPEAIEEQLQPGDRLLGYTDGVTEARSPSGGLFGLDQLEELLERELAAGQPVPETVRRLMRSVLDHQQGRLQDDAMLLLIEWNAPGSDHAAPTR